MPPEFTDELAAVVGAVIREALAPVVARLAATEATVGEIKSHTVEEVKATRDTLLTLVAKVAAVEARPPVPGPPGPAGKDGADGLGIDDLNAELTDERVVTLSFANGVRRKTIPIEFTGIVLYKGVYDEATAYVRGDVVTYDGSWWHCQAPTRATKPGTSPQWKLTVKRGRDGRDRP